MKPSGKNHGISAATLLAICLAGTLVWGNSGLPAPSAPKFDVPIPIGHDARVVRIPYYDDRGKLQQIILIDKAYRADDGHIDMKNAYMQTYDDKGTPDTSIFMTRAILDLNTRVVTSDVPVVVRRSDFQITGQKMVFNTQTHKGEMSGHVHMIIYNRQAANKPAASPSPAARTSPRPKSTP